MNSMPEHHTEEQFYGVIDGGIAGADREEIMRHLAVCSRCRARYDSLVRFDRLIARMPLSSVGPMFTQTVLAKVGLQPLRASSSRLIDIAVGSFGLLLLGAVTVAVLAVMGIFEPMTGTESSASSSPIFNIIGSAVTQVSVELGRMLKEFFPFLNAGSSIWTSLGALGAVLLLLVMDSAIGKRPAEKGR